MFFREAQFQPDGHGRCNLLPRQTLSSHSANLSPLGVRTPSQKIPYTCSDRIVMHHRQGPQRQELAGCRERHPFTVTRSRSPGTRAGNAHCDPMQPASGRCSRFGLSLVERLKPINQPTRQDPALGRRIDRSHGGVKARTQRTRAVHARGSDVCQESIGESCSVSWRWW